MSATPTGTGAIHRTRSARFTSWVFAAGGLLSIAVGVFLPGSRWLSVVPGALLFVAALRTRRSGVGVDEDGVTVMNLVRDIRVPWSDVEGFEVADDGPFSGRRRGRPTHGWLLTHSRGWIPLDCTMSGVDEAARLVFVLEEARSRAQPPTRSER